MVRIALGMAILSLLIPASSGQAADEMPLPQRRVTAASESVPEGAAPIAVTTELFELSFTKLERETGLSIDLAPNEQLQAQQLEQIVVALRQSSGASSAPPAAQAIDAEAFLRSLEQHNIAKVVKSAGEVTASGPQNRLVAGGLESIADHVGTPTRTRSSSQTRFYAIARANNSIALDLRSRFAVADETQGSDASWQPLGSIRALEWQLATVQPVGETSLWMGPVTELTEAVEQKTWYGRRKVVERVNRVATLLVVTAEVRQ